MKKKTKINFSNIFALLCILASIYLIHSIFLFTQIETFIRYLIIFLIIVFDIFITCKIFIKKNCLHDRISQTLYLLQILYNKEQVENCTCNRQK